MPPKGLRFVIETQEPMPSARYGAGLAAENGDGPHGGGALVVVRVRESRIQGEGGRRRNGVFRLTEELSVDSDNQADRPGSSACSGSCTSGVRRRPKTPTAMCGTGSPIRATFAVHGIRLPTTGAGGRRVAGDLLPHRCVLRHDGQFPGVRRRNRARRYRHLLRAALLLGI